MAWVNRAYADELAVVSTWIVALLPWSISFTSDAPLGSHVYFIRFPLFEIQARYPSNVTINGEAADVASVIAEYYGSGGPLVGNLVGVLPPMTIPTGSLKLLIAYSAWSFAGLAVLFAFILSIAMYLREDAVRSWLPVPYVMLTGILFGVVTILLIVASTTIALSNRPYGLPVPVGVLVVGAFAYLLSTVDLTESDERD